MAGRTKKEIAEMEERMYALPQSLLRKVATGEWTLEEAENGGPDFQYITADCASGCRCKVCR